MTTCYTKMEEITRSEPVTYCQPPPKRWTEYKTEVRTDMVETERVVEVPTSEMKEIQVPVQVKRTIEVPKIEYKVVEVKTMVPQDIWETEMKTEVIEVKGVRRDIVKEQKPVEVKTVVPIHHEEPQPEVRMGPQCELVCGNGPGSAALATQSISGSAAADLAAAKLPDQHYTTAVAGGVVRASASPVRVASPARVEAGLRWEAPLAAPLAYSAGASYYHSGLGYRSAYASRYGAGCYASCCAPGIYRY